MKNYLLLLLSIAHLSISAQTGGIRGLVLDADGLEAIGANIILNENSSTGTVTDLDGRFLFGQLAPGNYTITISYLSHQTKIIKNIEVTDKVVELGNIHLQESAIEIQTVVITAKALQNTETAIQTLQRKSLTPIDGISGQSFSAAGDGHAGAAIKRVTGVSVENGKYVFVRGLGGRYSLITLNGLSIPGLDPDRNTVQMDVFPTHILDNIVVYKAFSPDLPASFTGGLVNINTKDFPSELSGSLSFSLGFNPQVHFNQNFITHSGSSTDWLGYDNGLRQIPDAIRTQDPSNLQSTFAAIQPDEAGQLVRTFNNNNMEPIHSNIGPNYSLSFSLGNQISWLGKPLGFIAALSYKRNATFYQQGQYGRFLFIAEGADTLAKDEIFSVNRSTENVLIGGILSTTYKLNRFNKISLTLLFNQAGDKETRKQGGFVYSEGLGYQERFLAFRQRQLASTQMRGSHAFGQQQQYQLNWAGSYSLSNMEQPDLRFLNNAYIDTPTGRTYSIQPAIGLIPTRYWRNMTEQASNNKIDFSYNFNNWTERRGQLKVGTAWDYKKRFFDERIYQFESLSTSFNGNFNDYFSEENSISAEHPNGIFVTDVSNPQNNYTASSQVIGSYAMVEMPLTRSLKFIGGIRMEQAQIWFSNSKLPNSTLLNDLDILPAIGLIHTPILDIMNIRLNYNRTLARPVFREIANVAFYEFLNNNFLLGNPNLKRTIIDNLDLRWEFFPARGEKIILSAFYKKFTDPIELTNNPEAKNGEWIYQNVSEARVLGLEIEVRKHLNFSEWLKNFTLGGNLSLIQSEASIAADELANIRFHDPTAASVRPLFGQSPYLINAFLAYQNQRGTQGQLSYNVQGPRLYLVQIGAMPDVYEQPFHQLNLKLSQKMGKIQMGIGINNLLNSTFEQSISYKGKSYLFNAFRPGRNFSVEIKYEL